MARTDRRELAVEPELAGTRRPARSRLSKGHVVMLVTGLLAALLTYAALREATGVGTQVLVAAVDIPAGQTAGAASFSTAEVKGPAATGLIAAGDLPRVAGQIAVVDIPRGALVTQQELRPAAAPPPEMAIPVDPDTIPGGPKALSAGSRIDVLGVNQAGLPVQVSGLEVLGPPTPTQSSFGTASKVSIDVAVTDTATARQILDATDGGHFVIRVTGSSGAG